jgi:O-antigen/teichoic acid export membrane protein
MHPIKKLASQTAVYGLSSIVGRLLNFLLVPLYTKVFLPPEYGIVTELFAYVVFIQIIITYGMETGFFRFSQKDYKLDTVFSTTIISLFTTSILFLGIILLFSDSISSALGYSESSEFIIWFGIILSVDAISAIPFAKLRQENKALKFAILKFVNIFTNIGLNLFFLLVCKDSKIEFFNNIYKPEIGVGYIFISNLVASVLTLILFIPDILRTKFHFDIKLLKLMLIYSLPLLISGLAGSVNETFDKVVLKFWLTVPQEIADTNNYLMTQIGIYGANTKIAVLMTLFVQAFRFAADPFYFAQAKQPNYEKVFADIMKYFVILGLLIFLMVTLYLDIFKYFINEVYFEGLAVVAPLLIGHLLLGMVYNLSFWYKLKDKTSAGIVIFIIGAFVTIILNYIFIPTFGYLASAWTNVACYIVMLIITYLWGNKYLPIKYDLKRIVGYFVLAVILYYISYFTKNENLYIDLVKNTIIFAIFFAVVAYFEKTKVLIREIKKILTRNGNKNSQ